MKIIFLLWFICYNSVTIPVLLNSKTHSYSYRGRSRAGLPTVWPWSAEACNYFVWLTTVLEKVPSEGS